MVDRQASAGGSSTSIQSRLLRRRDGLRRPATTARTQPDDRLCWRPAAECRPPSRLAWAFILFSYTYYSQAFVTAFHGIHEGDASVASVGQTDIVSTLWQGSILAGLVFLFVRDPRWLLRHASKMTLYFAICGLCLLSTLWSDVPGTTLRRSVTFTECILFSIYAFDTLGLARMIRMLGRLAVFLAVCSLVVYVAVPSVGHETAQEYANAMRGVFPQKNTMAECMLLAITYFCYGMVADGRVGWRNPLVILFLFGCIVLTRSASSAVVALLVFLVTAVMLLRTRPVLRLGLRLLFAWCILAVVTLGVLAPDILLAGLGRDASLTGRVPLWVEVMHAIAKRPLLGYGYAGFFHVDLRDTQYLWLMAGWEAPDAHDGYMDIVIQIGLVGLVLYTWLWGTIIARAWRYSADPAQPLAKWILLTMLVNVLVNLDEGPLPFADWFTMLLPPMVITVGYWREREARDRARRLRQPAARLVPQVPRASTLPQAVGD